RFRRKVQLLSNTHIRDSGMEALARLGNLDVLSIEGTQITDAGLTFTRLSTWPLYRICVLGLSISGQWAVGSGQWTVDSTKRLLLVLCPLTSVHCPLSIVHANCGGRIRTHVIRLMRPCWRPGSSPLRIVDFRFWIFDFD